MTIENALLLRASQGINTLKFAPWLVFVLAAAVYLSTGHRLGASGDSVPSSLIPIAILLHGSIRLDEFVPVLEPHWNNQLPYFLAQTHHGVISLYPLAGGLLTLPIVALPILRTEWLHSPSPAQWLIYAQHYQFLSAAIITAISAALFWIVCTDLGLGFWLTIGLTLFYAFGSEAFSTSSQMLWQQGPGTLCIILAIFFLVRLQSAKGASERYLAILLSVALAVTVAVRPMNVVLIAPLFLGGLWRRPRLALFLTLPAAVIGTILIGYNLFFFGNIIGGYGPQTEAFRFTILQFAIGFFGLLFSPGRGLFFYFPIAAVTVAFLIVRPRLLREPLLAVLTVSSASLLLFFSFFVNWTGGWSVGPRYLTEIQPLLLLLMGLAFLSLAEPARRRLGILCFAILLPYSIFIQSVCTYSNAAMEWNNRPHGNMWSLWDGPINSAFQ